MNDPIVLYIHGKGGNAEEAEHYRPLFPARRVVGFDYSAQTPREAQREFGRLFDEACGGAPSVTLVACSIGAYFALCALGAKPIEKAYFISPVTDMERLILDLLAQTGFSEDDLFRRGTVRSASGEVLSREELSFVRAQPVLWRVPTRILCGENDLLIPPSSTARFARRIGASLTVMPGGEHWFHTGAQMAFLDRWISDAEKEDLP